MIILNVTYNIKPGMRESFVKALQENNIEECVSKEPGNLVYSFYLPINTKEENQVFLLERYEDEDAFAFHKEQEHFKKLQEIKAKYVLSTDIQILNS